MGEGSVEMIGPELVLDCATMRMQNAALQIGSNGPKLAEFACAAHSEITFNAILSGARGPEFSSYAMSRDAIRAGWPLIRQSCQFRSHLMQTACTSLRPRSARDGRPFGSPAEAPRGGSPGVGGDGANAFAGLLTGCR